MDIAIEHNPQMAVYDTETRVYDKMYMSELFISWFALVSLGVFACLSMIIWIVRGFKK